jgi:glycosyltransferase involved in cell wall biosynthesis
MTLDRLAQGWSVPDFGKSRMIINPDPATVRRTVEQSAPEAVHVMAGARWQELGRVATHECLAKRRRVGILSESPDPRGPGGFARWVKYTAEYLIRGRRYDFVLGMGEMGVQWFRHCGYAGSRAFPFAYVVDSVVAQPDRPSAEAQGIRILFVGQLIQRKGLDQLLQAFGRLQDRDARLQLVGDGPEKPALMRRAVALGVSARVEWLPPMTNSQTRSLMANADILVLPSRHDGWGAVVNESLMCGTPVLCSDRCGAKDLLKERWRGEVLACGAGHAWAEGLARWIQKGPLPTAERERIRGWSRCIGGAEVARYFDAILKHIYQDRSRPAPPWTS